MRRWNFQGNILVSNLSEDATPASLAELFDDYGLVLGVQIKEIVSNAGLRLLGVVALAPEGAAEKAIEGLQGRVVDNRKLKLKKAVQKPKVKPPGAPAPRRPRAPVGPPPDDFLPIPRPMAMREQNLPDPMASAAPRREPVVVQTRTPRKVIVEYKSGAGRIARPAISRAKPESD